MKLTVLDTLEGAVELFARAFFPLVFVTAVSVPGFILCAFFGYAILEVSHSLLSAELVLVVVLLPTVAAALGLILVTLANVQAGRRFRFGRIAGNMLDCWAQFMKLMVVQAAVTLAASLAAGLCLAGAYGIYTQIAHTDRAAANVAAIVAGVPLGLMALLVIGLFSLILGMASVGCFVERTGGFTSLGLAWARAIESGFIRRTLRLAVAVALVSLGFGGLAGLLGAVARAPGSPSVRLYAGIGSALLQLVFVYFLYSWFVVCYFRLRDRIEPLGFLKGE